MSKRSRSLAKREAKESAKGGKVISFLGGLVFVTAVIGFTVVKNRSLYDEISRQTNNALTVSKNIVSQVQLVADRINGISKLIKADSSEFASDSKNKALVKAEAGITQETRTDVRISDGDGNEENDKSGALKATLEAYERFWLFDV
jgi:hypothetical protein